MDQLAARDRGAATVIPPETCLKVVDTFRGKEVFFEQVHVPGREAAIDFTDGRELDVSVRGADFRHLPFQYVLSYSGWTWVGLAFGETFEALSAGIQGAIWELGGTTEVLRSDNLSAATHELKLSGGRGLTTRYAALLAHYGMRSTRIRAGESHENGVVEKRHHPSKSAIAQALVIRGRRDFDSAADYLKFVREVVARHNRRVDPRLADERIALRPLPAAAVPAYSQYETRVRCWSTVRVAARTYSVPSRLIGHVVEARVHPDTVEIYYRGRLVEGLPGVGKSHATSALGHALVAWVRTAEARPRRQLPPRSSPRCLARTAARSALPARCASFIRFRTSRTGLVSGGLQRRRP